MFIADRWHIPVSELASRMSASELTWWHVWHARRQELESQARATPGAGRQTKSFGDG